jgi:transposase-like protein
MLSSKRDRKAAKRFFKKALSSNHNQIPKVNKTLKGIEAMNMIKKGQVNDLNYSVLNEVKYINQLFGIGL